MQIKGYNLLVDQKDYPAADQYLNALNSTRTEQYNYVYAQNVYLDHLINKNYIPNTSTLSTLHQYGNVDNVLSGSIRAIYEYFTGEFIELDVTIEGYNPIIPRRPESLQKGSEFKIYPNPLYSHDAIKVELPSNLDVNLDLTVVIKNINGQSLLMEKIKSNLFDIDVSSLDSGMYFLLISDKNGKVLELKKIVLL